MPDADDQYGLLYEGGRVVARYLLSVITAAMIIGILDGILDKKSAASGLLRLIGGLFLTFTLLQPLTKMNFIDITDYIAAFGENAETISALGEDLAEEEKARIIKAKTEAYILDKAQGYGLTLDVEVTLSEESMAIPVGVRLAGAVSPYARWQLQKMMEEDLGIGREDQIWTG